ncbi:MULTISPECIES: hypothetical protein [Pseudomonas]|jgi:hypothetical protein|uniref:Uncharacterized protein n=1 Tax=Pseudomonas putida TaxID=303 RepID=A0A1Q9QVM2_PSEPU|nr:MULTISPECIES: hypothetical protein [Pseudomonas]OLS59204.1 hypothetical protein PSEMO_57130 [Pseudomonas putida]
MERITWFAADNPEKKRIPEWRRSCGFSDKGTIFVPAAMAGDETEFNVMLCAQGDRQPLAIHLDHYFVCSTWLKQEFPKHLELIEIIENRVHQAIAEMAQQKAKFEAL